MIAMIPTGVIPLVWSDAVALLSPAISLSNGEVTEGSTHRKLLAGETALVLVFDDEGHITMAFTLEVLVYESGKRELAIPLMGGSGLDDLSSEFMPFVEEQARSANCSAIVGYAARRGWARKLKDYGWTSIREIIKHEVKL